MHTKPQSRVAYEHLHDQSMADGIFYDVCAREFSQNQTSMIGALRRHGTYMREQRIGGGTAFLPERFYSYYDRLVESFTEQ